MWGLHQVHVHIGDHAALAGVDLPIEPGSVTAIVGGDGAGKTTALRLLAGRRLPDAGTVQAPAPDRIGFQPATSGVWRELTTLENLQFAARAYHLGREVMRERIDDLLAATGLSGARDRLAGQLSGGMRQKLGFGMAIVHQPDLLLLDEPTTGVDPVSRVDLWQMIADAAAGGMAVVMATTYLDEAERTHRVLVVDAGRPLACGTPADILAQTPGAVLIGPTAAPSATPQNTWRRGRQVHSWLPNAPATPAADMEDCVIALTLAAEAAESAESQEAQ